MNNKKQRPTIDGERRWVFQEAIEAAFLKVTMQILDSTIEKIAHYFEELAEYDKNEYWPPQQIADEIRKFKWWIPPEGK